MRLNLNPFCSTRSCPSNIAFIKYWGKAAEQIPANPSISMTLDKCRTKTSLTAYPLETSTTKEQLKFTLEGESNPKFELKVKNFVERLASERPYLKKLCFEIETQNNFPHSAGIASSASGMGALALVFNDLHHHFFPNDLRDFEQISSYWARLGSGSACRSTFAAPLVSWGLHPDIKSSSNEFATPLSNERIHSVYHQLQDSILIVSDRPKPLSSRAGHELMNEHPYRDARYAQANQNFSDLLVALNNGDWNQFDSIVKAEAHALHALIMSSARPTFLITPLSLQLINEIELYKKATQVPLTYTLDAGPNLHLIYPLKVKNEVQQFIEMNLKPLLPSKKVIYDQASLTGPHKLNEVKL